MGEIGTEENFHIEDEARDMRCDEKSISSKTFK
jgi:hypothetical protein